MINKYNEIVSSKKMNKYNQKLSVFELKQLQNHFVQPNKIMIKIAFKM